MKRMLLALALSSILLFFNGCSWVFAEPDKLITAPASDTAKFQERKVITSLLADDEHITVPKEMETPAPSIDIDLDGDGKAEKVVFWVKNNGFQSGITVLKQKNPTTWSVIDQKRISGRDIVYFNALDMNGDGKQELFLGVDIGGYNTLYIYKMTQDGLEKIDQMNYSLLAFAQLKNEKTPNLICALSNSTGTVSSTDLNTYEWTKKDGFKRIFQQTYDGFCQEMDYGVVGKDKKGLYLALSSDYNSVNVMLLTFQDGVFREQLHREVFYVNALAERSGGIIQDINDDGILDVLSIRPPADASKREPREFLQVWRTWNGKDDLLPIYSVIENKSDGYQFVVPLEWLPGLRYHYVMESGNSQLKFFDETVSSSGEPVFTIFSKELDEESDINKLKKDKILLGTSPSNQRVYLATINKDKFAEDAITPKHLIDAFKVEGGQ